ncbi:MAG: N-acetyltransferase [Erysipelothrix sp.]
MIRLMEIPEIDEVMDLWINTNFEVHDYVDSSYWRENYDSFKEMLENANIYVSVDNNRINGFAGVLGGHYLSGIFVDSISRNNGVGKELMNHLKERYDELTLNVYQQNKKAIKFYEREGFVVIDEDVEEETNIPEFTMAWPENL